MNKYAIKELNSLLKGKQNIANLKKPNNAISQYSIDEAKGQVIELQESIKQLSTEGKVILGKYELVKTSGDKKFGSDCKHENTKNGICTNCLRKIITNR